MERAEDDVEELFDQIEEARTGADTLTELADIIGSNVETSVLVSKRGISEDGESIELPMQNDLLNVAFESEIDTFPRTNFI